MGLSEITDRHAILSAVNEYDRLGRESFLTKYGFRQSRAYWLAHDGRRYDSKAIVGVAHRYARPDLGPLRAIDFTGGEATVRRLLQKLGFAVEVGRAVSTAGSPASGQSPGVIPAGEADDDPFDPESIEDARTRISRTILQRRGQRAFRDALLSAYDGRCAITGCSVPDVLEAAHIYPYRGPDTNKLANGLLLRADLHTLFDCGLLTIDSKSMTAVLAPALRNSEYADIHGRNIRVPRLPGQKPSQEALDMHRLGTGF